MTETPAVLVLLILILAALCAILGVLLWTARRAQATSAAAPSANDVTGLHVTMLANILAELKNALHHNANVVNAHGGALAHYAVTTDGLAQTLRASSTAKAAAPAAPSAEPAPELGASAAEPAPVEPPDVAAWDPTMLAKLSARYSHELSGSEDLLARVKAMEARIPAAAPGAMLVPGLVAVTPAVADPTPAPAQTLPIADPGPTVLPTVAASGVAA